MNSEAPAPHPNPPPRGGRESRRACRHVKEKFAGESRYKHKNDPADYRRARGLRREMPPAERLLWKALREIPKERGLTFRRQHPLRPYIVDFVCLKIKFVIELDGDSHDARQNQDKQRDLFLARSGDVVLRFNNAEVRDNLQGVVETIMNVSKKLLRQKSAGTDNKNYETKRARPKPSPLAGEGWVGGGSANPHEEEESIQR